MRPPPLFQPPFRLSTKQFPPHFLAFSRGPPPLPWSELNLLQTSRKTTMGATSYVSQNVFVLFLFQSAFFRPSDWPPFGKVVERTPSRSLQNSSSPSHTFSLTLTPPGNTCLRRHVYLFGESHYSPISRCVHLSPFFPGSTEIPVDPLFPLHCQSFPFFFSPPSNLLSSTGLKTGIHAALYFWNPALLRPCLSFSFRNPPLPHSLDPEWYISSLECPLPSVTGPVGPFQAPTFGRFVPSVTAIPSSSYHRIPMSPSSKAFQSEGTIF